MSLLASTTCSPNLVGAVTGMQAFILVQWIVAEKEGEGLDLKVTTQWAILLTYCAMSANLLSLILAQYCISEIQTGKMRDMKEAAPAVLFEKETSTSGVVTAVAAVDEVGAPWSFYWVYCSYQLTSFITWGGKHRISVAACVGFRRTRVLVHFTRRQLLSPVLNPPPLVAARMVPCTLAGNLCFFAAMGFFLQDQPIPADFKLATTIVMGLLGGVAIVVPAVLKFAPDSA